jgi:NhaA family Na+:H+ antiporter
MKDLLDALDPSDAANAIVETVRDFLRLEAASGILLLIAAALAMVAENTAAHTLYDGLLSTLVAIRVGDFEIAKPFLLWVNDGLMAIFFLTVGLEIKREVVKGELSNPATVALPVISAVGGMAAPALIYVAINWGDPVAMKGWAIPSATDIAFALGVLALLGDRVPQSLKLFLLTLAIVDDLGAIVVIALFYTADISPTSLAVAGLAAAVLLGLNRKRVVTITPYIAVGVVLWVAVLKSGVHATLAGVLIALFIPLRTDDPPGQSPLERLLHDLHPTVAYGILPVFAFCNTGISLDGLSLGSLAQPVPLGIATGLFFGKQIGVLGLAWLAVRLGIGRLPVGASWPAMAGIALLCGVGFTMSLFISSLAFEQGGAGLGVDDRLGILVGSILSAVVGYGVLRRTLPRPVQ